MIEKMNSATYAKLAKMKKSNVSRAIKKMGKLKGVLHIETVSPRTHVIEVDMDYFKTDNQ